MKDLPKGPTEGTLSPADKLAVYTARYEAAPSTNGRIPKAKRPAAAALSQAEKFEKASRDLGCVDDDDKLKGVLRKLAKPKA